jgi:acylphosphatase
MTYTGHVQGVGCRWTVARIATRYAVVGTVRNVSDGSVELVAQASPAVLEAFLREVEESMAGYIQQANRSELPAGDDLTGFQILR